GERDSAAGAAFGMRVCGWVGTLAKVLRETRQRYGVAAICIGVGQGLAVVLENCDVTGVDA
ncbi:hypothetical protein ABZ931_22480, partial [Streptomyces neyagawaensis]